MRSDPKDPTAIPVHQPDLRLRIRVGSVVLVLAAVHWIVEFPSWLEWLIAVPLIAVLGISHGAVDHLIALRTRPGQRIPSVIGRYLLLMLIYGVLWYLSPPAGLVVFILLSVYHFGEAELHHIPVGGLLRLSAFTAWGVTLLGSLFLFHLAEIAVFLEELLPTFDAVRTASIIRWVTIACGMLTAGVFLIAARRYPGLRPWAAARIAGFGLLLLLFQTASLLLSFAVFFGLWHALPVLKEEYRFLKAQDDLSDARDFAGKLAPFTLLSLVGIAALAGVLYAGGTGYSAVIPIVIGVSVLTLPHALVMRDMYRGQQDRAVT